MPKDRFGGIVVKVRIKINGGITGVHIHPPAGQGAGHFHDIVLGIAIALPHREELHEFAGVVFVRLLCDILIPIEEGEHRRINAHFFHESAEIAKCPPVQQVVIMPHEGIAGIVVFPGHKLVVPEQCQLGPYALGSHFPNPAAKEGALDFKISLHIVIRVIVVSPVGPVRGIGSSQVGGPIEQLVGQRLRRKGQPGTDGVMSGSETQAGI